MRQYEPYIQTIIIILIKKIKTKIKKKSKKKKRWERESVREREREILFFFLSSLLSKIYGNRTVGFHWTKGKASPRIESYAWAPKS